MALLVNTIAASSLIGRRMGGLTILPMAGLVRSERFCFLVGEHAPSQRSGQPNGHSHPSSWMLPFKTGGMSSAVRGSGLASGSAILALQMLATLIGQGGATAQGGLIVNLLATITGQGGINTASIQAFLNLLATIGGAGGVQGGLTGLAALQAQLQGQGAASGTARGIGSMSATIRGYGDLTPEGIRDAVWDAVATQYNDPGSMGAKVNSAASGGVDYNALAAAVWAHATRTLTAGAAPTPELIADALLATLQANTIPVNTVQIKGQSISGTGSEADPWGP